MADIKAKRISDLPPKTDITPDARLPIIDKAGNSYDNFSMSVALLTTLAKGDKGDTGPQGPAGPASTIPGPQGPAGKDGASIPTGGTAGQQLVKKSSADYDYAWETPAGGGDMLSSVYDQDGGHKQVAFKDDMNTALSLKSDKSTTYTKTEVDTKIANATPADATTTSKGVIKLAGALGGTADLPTVPDLATKEPTIAAGTTSQYYRGDKTWQTLDKSAVGLSNVDNTSDADKPVSAAVQAAISAAIPTVRSQSYTTNSIVANPVIQTGWNQFLGNGTSNQSVNITFPASFTSVRSVQVSWLGYKNTAGAAASIGGFDTSIGVSSFIGASRITNNGFRADFYINGAFGGKYHGFSWTAIGTM